MRDLNISLVQRPLMWENPAYNRTSFSRDIASVAGDTDLVILPEMFTTGFSMAAAASAETIDGETANWMLQQAAEKDCALLGSLPIRAGNDVYNRLLFATPDGQLQHYDKRHLFRVSGEHKHYSAGAQRPIIEWRDWRLCPQVCYDLRFPVWTRNRNDYDLLIFVANWPAKRAAHWRALLLARAIENQACVIGVNRVGSDDNGLSYSGDSLALAADGTTLVDCADGDGVFRTVLEAGPLLTYRKKFPVQLDADKFTLED